MRYREGALVFYAALATRLVPEIGKHTSVQLVVPVEASLPEKDCLAIAKAISTRDRDSLHDCTTLDGPSADPWSLPDSPLIIDCRGMNSADAAMVFRESVMARTDIVVVTGSEIALLGARVVLLSTDSNFLFDAVSETFAELLSQHSLRLSTGGVLMPARFLARGLQGVQDDFELFHDGAAPPLGGASLDRYCASLSRTWEFQDRQVSALEVSKWLRQFEKYDAVQEASSLLTYLNRFGYLSKAEIVNKILTKYYELCKQGDAIPELVSVQSVGKSESMLLYNLREIWTSFTKQFHDAVASSVIEHIVLCDDVIGSGETVLECLFEGAGTVASSEFSQWLALQASRVSVIVAIASERGIRNIEGDTRCEGKINVYASQVLNDVDRIFADGSKAFENSEARDRFRSLCRYIGSSLSPSAPLGWADCEWCVVTSYNTPDCSLPILWANGTTDIPWTPLFPRL